MSRELTEALFNREQAYSQAIERLRDIASPETENEVHDITLSLREAVELVRCLRRITQGRTTREIHAAFGAPGDFGYENPIGAALALVYSGKASP
jgi:hypothetical protein